MDFQSLLADIDSLKDIFVYVRVEDPTGPQDVQRDAQRRWSKGCTGCNNRLDLFNVEQPRNQHPTPDRCNGSDEGYHETTRTDQLQR